MIKDNYYLPNGLIQVPSDAVLFGVKGLEITSNDAHKEALVDKITDLILATEDEGEDACYLVSQILNTELNCSSAREMAYEIIESDSGENLLKEIYSRREKFDLNNKETVSGEVLLGNNDSMSDESLSETIQEYENTSLRSFCEQLATLFSEEI